MDRRMRRTAACATARRHRAVMTVQKQPQSDNRYRVHRSVKCYLAELICGSAGCTWYFRDSIERVVYLFPGGTEKVRYKTHYYCLNSSERMNEIVAEQLRLGWPVDIGGKHTLRAINEFTPYPFIDVSSSDDQESYERLRNTPRKG